ncbi:hypothetical protein DSO57_1020768 [Entomophthora muscae]|uniref:Uncharacterized protein n=1 Tax=Entomophthora muscae TaxID=34485 RepID=A0ACC2RUR1_9FUNG|nr:hypothetical protein DSO57_1020768 [Entomophthora muscae]
MHSNNPSLKAIHSNKTKPSTFKSLIKICLGKKPRYTVRSRNPHLLDFVSAGDSLRMKNSSLVNMNKPKSCLAFLLQKEHGTFGNELQINATSHCLHSCSKFFLSFTSPPTLSVLDFYGNTDRYQWITCPRRRWRRKLVEIANPTETLATYTSHPKYLTRVFGLGTVIFNFKLAPHLILAFIFLLSNVLMKERHSTFIPLSPCISTMTSETSTLVDEGFLLY